jgi:hypothetical protein
MALTSAEKQRRYREPHLVYGTKERILPASPQRAAFDRARPPRWVNRDLPRAPLRQLGGTPRRARVPPVDYWDGLPSRLTNRWRADITTSPNEPVTPGTPGRDQLEWVVAIRRNGWSQSPVCAL